MSRQPTLFDSWRISMRESIELTTASLAAYGARHRHWGLAWSGGKDYEDRAGVSAENAGYAG